MGIGWLLLFTLPDHGQALRARNDRLAARWYSRWRALHDGIEDLIDRVRETSRCRALRRELDGLSDDRLDDVGLVRDADGVVRARDRRSEIRHDGHIRTPGRSTIAASTQTRLP